jgi:molybdate-binding protein
VREYAFTVSLVKGYLRQHGIITRRELISLDDLTEAQFINRNAWPGTRVLTGMLLQQLLRGGSRLPR